MQFNGIWIIELVLILILLEDGFWFDSATASTVQQTMVLILILLEDGFW